MDTRADTRIPTNLIPVRVTGLGNLELDTSGRITDVSPNGLRVSLPEMVPAGSLLRLEFEDATIFGEVRHCEWQDRLYTIGLFVEEVLIGTSDLARMVASLKTENGSSRHGESAARTGHRQAESAPIQ